LVHQLKVPPGFQVNVFASKLMNPRMMAVAQDGSVYVTRPEQEDVIVLRDKNGDGKSDEMKQIAKQIETVHGIAIHENQLYLCGVNELFRLNMDGSNPQRLISDLPEGGNHDRRTMHFGPDGKLYVSIGSTCNNCIEENKEHATMLVLNADASNRKIFA